MQWSKLRSTVRNFICPELRSRIDFHVTSYRGSHDEAEKAWVTVDGCRVLTASWYQHQWYGWPKDAKGRLDHVAEFPKGIDKFKEEVHLPQEVGRALRAYLDLSISDALSSDDPFIRALSIVDRRIGRRTLQSLRIDEDDHSLVKAFFLLRAASMVTPSAQSTIQPEVT